MKAGKYLKVLKLCMIKKHYYKKYHKQKVQSNILKTKIGARNYLATAGLKKKKIRHLVQKNLDFVCLGGINITESALMVKCHLIGINRQFGDLFKLCKEMLSIVLLIMRNFQHVCMNVGDLT